ncbi:hypothetical protein PV327_001109 [Microctonus hyperodae]|uniref:Uncharacterized protein n=1 Tax=Microctonus hyperodae TaxID=165561 RepID=A0AA39G8Q6_MICHY|nr:hypothetical protein PV327_001109 [Microctonus hyperodae]
MHQRSFALTALLFIIIIVELSVVIITAEPTYRHHRGLIADNKEVVIDCTNDYTNLKCRSKFLNRNETQSIHVGRNDYGAEKKVEDEKKSLNAMELLNDHKDEDDDDDDDGDGAIEEGRGKKKKKGMGKVLFMLAAAMKGTLLYAMIHGVAIIAGKALVVAKIALALAAAVALKKSLEHHDKTSYEIVKHPQHSFSQTHSASVDYDHHGGFEGHRRRRKRRYVR